jgi:hypothetical protein
MAKKTDMGGEMPPMPPEAMMAPEPEAAPQSGGQVMLQIPKDVFMGIHQLVVQLAQDASYVARRWRGGSYAADVSGRRGISCWHG